MPEDRKIFQKCEQCGNFFDPDNQDCPYCPTVPTSSTAKPQQKGSRRWGIAFGLLTIASFVILALVFWFNPSEPVPAPSTEPTIATGPTPTPRPLCRDRREELVRELSVLLLSSTNEDINIELWSYSLDEERDGTQDVWIKFQAYKPGTGKYPKGNLFVEVDDVTCEIVSYDLHW